MVIQSYVPVVGGAQRQLESLAPLLEHRGVESICVTRLQGSSPIRERRPGIEVRRIRVPPSSAAASLAYTGGGVASVGRASALSPPTSSSFHGVSSTTSRLK